MFIFRNMKVLFKIIFFILLLFYNESVKCWSASSFLKDFGDVFVDSTFCLLKECCNSRYIKADFNGLKQQLDYNLYGQHLVKGVVLNALQDHFEKPNPKKALAITFHGWPGIGKNYVVEFIVNNLYKLGFNSQYVHSYVAQIHFPSKDLVPLYQRNLYSEIRAAVRKCPRQIFIFDEVDKIPRGVLDILKPVLDVYEHIDNIDFRKATFIFISNTGGTEIADILHNHIAHGTPREQLKLHNFEHLVRLGAFNEIGSGIRDIIDRWANRLYAIVKQAKAALGGLQYADAIENNLIDHYIPFLPLERKHIELCIHDEFKRRKVIPTQQQINEVMEYITFDAKYVFFATTGCKRVDQKVGAILKEKLYKEKGKAEL